MLAVLMTRMWCGHSRPARAERKLAADAFLALQLLAGLGGGALEIQV